MVKMKVRCPDCMKEISVHVGQAVSVGEIVWYRSYKCHHCGMAMEEDGGGDDIPNSIRKEILKADGTWALYVKANQDVVKVYKVLRKEMGLTLSDISRIKKSFIDQIMTGTFVEMKYLKEKFSKENLDTYIERIP